jgi:hypothetical protein
MVHGHKRPDSKEGKQGGECMVKVYTICAL